MFTKESIVNAVNKIFDKYKNNLDKAETINYVDDTDLADVKENKNAKIAAKKVTEKHKRLGRKRKLQPTPAALTVDGFRNPSKKRKRATKSAIITARNIAKKYKKMRYKKPPPTFFVDKTDLETIDYNNDSDHDMFAKESIVIAVSKIFDKQKKCKQEIILIKQKQ